MTYHTAFQETFGYSLEEAMKKALKAGYQLERLPDMYVTPARRFGLETVNRMLREHVLFDPHFWVALGKAEGWGVTHIGTTGSPIRELKNTTYQKHTCGRCIPAWQYMQHRLINTINSQITTRG